MPAPSEPASKQEPSKEDASPARFNLSEGLVGETADKAFQYHVGGRFDWDSGWYNVPANLQQSLNTPLLDGTDLRRFRLGADGTVWEQVDFAIDRVIPGYARVVPVRNFHWTRANCGCGDAGPGAWEVGVRYHHVDVNSGLIQAGVLDSITLGLNWYLNPNARVTANYVYTDRNTGSPSSSGNFSALGVRVHFDF